MEEIVNPVLILTRNNLELTKRCVESVLAQDIPVVLNVQDNKSTDGTCEWLEQQKWSNESFCALWTTNYGVSFGWNRGLESLFFAEYKHVLVLNNDTILPPWFYRTLLSYDAPFVTGVAVDQMPTEEPQRMPLVPHPDFSAFLIRRECWETVGPFDEEMMLYASDCDYHVRAHQLGVHLMKANVPFYHVNSQTLRRADPQEQRWIHEQANRDREVFKRKWGGLPGTPEYEALFTEVKSA